MWILNVLTAAALVGFTIAICRMLRTLWEVE